MVVFINHVGYEPDREKVFVTSEVRDAVGTFVVVNEASGSAVLEGRLSAPTPSARWSADGYARGDFSALRTPGRYWIEVPTVSGRRVTSGPFEVSEGLYRRELLSDLLFYFKSQRSSHHWDRADRAAPLVGSDQRFDVHGGWYDASGDVSKYLSHLSYANFMNPQQSPLVVWVLLAAAGPLGGQPPFFRERLTDEALYGADFLVRMQHPSGAFFMTLFDQWNKDPDNRWLCAYETRQGTRTAAWQASYRQGGGLAVAALARAAAGGRGADFGPEDYRRAARDGFEALESLGPHWCDDGQENLLDDYAALLAACELAADGFDRARGAAERRVARLVIRLTPEGWWRADAAGERSFFHGSDAGLPVLALLRFLEVFPGSPWTSAVEDAIERSLRFELGLDEGDNPFGYPRHWVKQPGRPGRAQFFLPHENESGYWWQGENARLGSLAAAAWSAAGRFPALAEALDRRAHAALDWILGRNPFDMAMMHGKGRRNPQYEPGYYPAPGGVCNGVTSGDDPETVAFRTTEEVGPLESWRWGEQWLPHAAWLFLAVSLRPDPVTRLRSGRTEP